MNAVWKQGFGHGLDLLTNGLTQRSGNILELHGDQSEGLQVGDQPLCIAPGAHLCIRTVLWSLFTTSLLSHPPCSPFTFFWQLPKPNSQMTMKKAVQACQGTNA